MLYKNLPKRMDPNKHIWLLILLLFMPALVIADGNTPPQPLTMQRMLKLQPMIQVQSA